ncbi:MULTISPECIES: hypothetical protein [Methylococcus]|uniref:Uncharacterized protein n=1 Tax=Methylococcus capsulatus TaxID=414 RepID=A0ABZ2F6N6_METCP|nr:hypothetical protein [Methylococcus sp. BF19-07]
MSLLKGLLLFSVAYGIGWAAASSPRDARPICTSINGDQNISITYAAKTLTIAPQNTPAR